MRFNYGSAGIIYIQKLIEVLQNDEKSITNGYDLIYKHLQGKWPDRISSHLAAVATVCVADFLSSQWIFGLCEEMAYDQCIELADEIIKQLETLSEIDDAERAYAYFISWYYSSYDKFQDDKVTPERCGFMHMGNICCFPNVFEKTMKDGGFNVNRVLKDWANNGWIVTDIWGPDKKRRFKVKRKDVKTQSYIYVVAVKNRTNPGGDHDEEMEK